MVNTVVKPPIPPPPVLALVEEVLVVSLVDDVVAPPVPAVVDDVVAPPLPLLVPPVISVPVPPHAAAERASATRKELREERFIGIRYEACARRSRSAWIASLQASVRAGEK
jgi:hypothetical protein